VSKTRTVDRRTEAAPVHSYEPVPGEPPVRIGRLDRRSLGGVGPGHAHSHDFLVLAYFERGGGSLRMGSCEWPVEAGDVYVVAPGEVVGVGERAGAIAEVEGWAVSFPPEGLGPNAPDALLSWRAHPLLFPFARGAAQGGQRLKVPVADRRAWAERLSALDREMQTRRDGYREAVVAHLTLLLVDVSRLAADVAGDLKLRNEPLLAQVFDFIERHYQERISLRDVAAAVNMSSGHLTTIVRRKTGRPVQEWITERRMAQARRLLAETDLTVTELGHRVGYTDPVYFVRSFRRAHGTTPLRWRRAGRQ
jgi:AraC family transcriptional regulator, transcriptional activator of pobA